MDSTAQKPNLKAVPTAVGEIEYQETSLDIWDNKYCLKTKKGEPVDQNMDDTFKRVALALTEVEKESDREHWYKEFLWALRHGVIPAGRIISNAEIGRAHV